MAAVIWDVQLRRYPAFARVDPGGFPEFHAAHVTSISTVVIPLMLLELVSGLALLAVPSATSLQTWERWAGIVLVAIVWGSTFLIQVPLHNRLSAGFDLPAIRQLVASNWVRTVAWSARALLVAVALLR